MQISLNAKPWQFDEPLALDQLVARVSDRPSGIAVAVNGEVVPRGSWPDTFVTEGDRVDVVTAVQGG